MRIQIAAFLALASLGSTARAEAQNYKSSRVDLTLVGAVSGWGEAGAWGAGLAVEPKANLTDQFSLGLRIEITGMVTQSIAPNAPGGVDYSLGGRAAADFLFKADYYLTTSSVRPFVGLGAGLYIMTGGDVGTSGRVEAFLGFGLFPQIGANFGGFRLAVGYHAIQGDAMEVVVDGVPTGLTLPKSYFAFEIGGTFGGGRTTPEAQ